MSIIQPYTGKQTDPMIETNTIIQSRIISKAVTVEPDGSITIIVVFERSTYHQFFHIFKAPKSRTRRANWKYTVQYNSIYSGTPGDPFFSLRSYIATNYPHSAKVWRVRHLFGARALADLTKRISHPLQNSLNTIPTPGQTFAYANSRSSARAQSIRARGF